MRFFSASVVAAAWRLRSCRIFSRRARRRRISGLRLGADIWVAPGFGGMEAALNETALHHLNRGARGVANETGPASLRSLQVSARGSKPERPERKIGVRESKLARLNRGQRDTRAARATALCSKMSGTLLSFPASR